MRKVSILRGLTFCDSIVVYSCRLFGMLKRYLQLLFPQWTLITRFVCWRLFVYPHIYSGTPVSGHPLIADIYYIYNSHFRLSFHSLQYLSNPQIADTSLLCTTNPFCTDYTAAHLSEVTVSPLVKKRTKLSVLNDVCYIEGFHCSPFPKSVVFPCYKIITTAGTIRASCRNFVGGWGGRENQVLKIFGGQQYTNS